MRRNGCVPETDIAINVLRGDAFSFCKRGLGFGDGSSRQAAPKHTYCWRIFRQNERNASIVGFPRELYV
jgi:hypothetical protein